MLQLQLAKKEHYAYLHYFTKVKVKVFIIAYSQISSAQRNSYDLAANIYAVDGIQQVTKITYTKITYTRNNM